MELKKAFRSTILPTWGCFVVAAIMAVLAIVWRVHDKGKAVLSSDWQSLLWVYGPSAVIALCVLVAGILIYKAHHLPWQEGSNTGTQQSGSGERERLESEVQRLEAEKVKLQNESIEGVLSPLQIEVLKLAKDLKNFLKEMGNKPEARKEDFEDTRDGVEAYLKADFVVQEQWLTKFKSLYNKRFALRLQNAVNELGVHGLKSGCLDSCARAGIDDAAEAQLVIETLVSTAYQLDDIYVFPRNVYSAEQISMMCESDLGHKIACEPGFRVTYEQYLRTQATQASKGKKS